MRRLRSRTRLRRDSKTLERRLYFPGTPRDRGRISRFQHGIERISLRWNSTYTRFPNWRFLRSLANYFRKRPSRISPSRATVRVPRRPSNKTYGVAESREARARARAFSKSRRYSGPARKYREFYYGAVSREGGPRRRREKRYRYNKKVARRAFTRRRVHAFVRSFIPPRVRSLLLKFILSKGPEVCVRARVRVRARDRQ